MTDSPAARLRADFLKEDVVQPSAASERSEAGVRTPLRMTVVRVEYAGTVPSGASAGEDTRVWVGRVASGHEAEHARFVAWLNGPEAESIFLRRRLTEYTLAEQGDTVTVVFKARQTGDPRIMIDFLRYPGLWPEYWQFTHGGRGEDTPPAPAEAIKVHWRRAAQPTG